MFFLAGSSLKTLIEKLLTKLYAVEEQYAAHVKMSLCSNFYHIWIDGLISLNNQQQQFLLVPQRK
jgi:hypothetical protein